MEMQTVEISSDYFYSWSSKIANSRRLRKIPKINGYGEHVPVSTGYRKFNAFLSKQRECRGPASKR